MTFNGPSLRMIDCGGGGRLGLRAGSEGDFTSEISVCERSNLTSGSGIAGMARFGLIAGGS